MTARRCVRLNIGGLLGAMLLGACTGTAIPPPSATVATAPSASTASAPPAGATAPAEGVPIEQKPLREVATAAGSADERVGFSTRFASFEPARWEDLPDWERDAVAEGWAAFRRSCGALASRAEWRGVCARALALGAVDDAGVRRFMQREFSLYAVLKADRSPMGVITGYYEPLLHGSRTKGGAFVYPVYATPEDLLMLDIRSVPRELRGQVVGVRIAGRTVVPVTSGDAPYVLDVGDLQSDVRDKKLRVRREGNRIVPYPSRAQIEREGLPRGQIIAWVDNPAALYSMQIQGSGKIRLTDGRIIRLAYAEQNGHPFRPPVARSRVATRGGRSIGADGAGVDDADDISWRAALMLPDDESAPLTRGGHALKRIRTDPGAAPSGGAGALEPEVAQLIEDLASGRGIGGGGARKPSAAERPAVVAPPSAEKPAPAPKVGKPMAQPGGVVGAARPTQGKTSEASPGDGAPIDFPQPSAAMREAILSDPSYVFFREIPDGPEGPIGALGVPLTAGRSVAVDPRTTPLGFPVFLSTSLPGREGRLNRLVVAQDTGGAIRGAVRADYFWGGGSRAYLLAARMKESGRMWVLFPRDLPIAARERAVRTRGGGPAVADMDCVVEDPLLCVEDR